MFDLSLCQRLSRRDSVPFLKTAAAAAPGGMLRNEAGMPSHGCLPAVIGRIGGREAFQYEITALMLHAVHSLFRDDPQFRLPEPEAGTEFRFRQALPQILPFRFSVHDLSAVMCRSFFAVVI